MIYSALLYILLAFHLLIPQNAIFFGQNQTASAGDTIAFDGAAHFSSGTGTISVTWSHTVTSNTDGILCVSGGIVDTNGASVVSTVTWEGTQNLTKVNSYPAGTGYTASTNRAESWCLLAPATGTGNVVVTLSVAPAQDSGWTSVSLTGVNQSLTMDATGGATGASGQPNGSVTTVASNDWVLDGLVDNQNNDTPAATSPSVTRAGFNDTYRTFGSSTQPTTTPGSKTMAWTGINSGWVQSIIAMRPGP